MKICNGTKLSSKIPIKHTKTTITHRSFWDSSCFLWRWRSRYINWMSKSLDFSSGNYRATSTEEVHALSPALLIRYHDSFCNFRSLGELIDAVPEFILVWDGASITIQDLASQRRGNVGCIHFWVPSFGSWFFRMILAFAPINISLDSGMTSQCSQCFVTITFFAEAECIFSSQSKDVKVTATLWDE